MKAKDEDQGEQLDTYYYDGEDIPVEVMVGNPRNPCVLFRGTASRVAWSPAKGHRNLELLLDEVTREELMEPAQGDS